ncbi:MAG: MBL fold metallo-hydrolase [Actinobacteria bacterium]|nr:MBL fold metallo-hydrolase [Actinomycetota bacterium]
MALAVTPLGCSAMYATADVAASGYLVEVDGFTLWMDAGGGTWQKLLSAVDYADVNGMFLTHRHPDHTIDLFQFFHARLYGGRDLVPIPLWAPEETLERITAYSTELAQTFDLTAVSGDTVLDIGGGKATFVDMDHPVQTCGLRLQHDGAVLAYTADTGPTSDFHVLGHDADVVICEATFQDSDRPWWEGHMSATQAGRMANDVGASRLVLSHLPPTRDHQVSLREAVSEAGATGVELAEPGKRIEVGR